MLTFAPCGDIVANHSFLVHGQEMWVNAHGDMASFVVIHPKQADGVPVRGGRLCLPDTSDGRACVCDLCGHRFDPCEYNQLKLPSVLDMCPGCTKAQIIKADVKRAIRAIAGKIALFVGVPLVILIVLSWLAYISR